LKNLNFNYLDLQSNRSENIKPIILGTCNAKHLPQDNNLSKIEKRPFWIVLEGGNSKKLCSVKEIFLNGVANKSPLQVIHYNRSSSHYYSPKPLEFTISVDTNIIDESDLEIAIRKISTSLDVEKKIVSSLSNSQWRSFQFKTLQFFWTIFCNFFSKIGIWMIHLLDIDIEILGSISSFSFSGGHLKHQLEKLFIELPNERNKLNAYWKNSNIARSTFIKFYNRMFLLAIDLLLGGYFGYLLLENSNKVLEFVTMCNDYLTNVVLRSQIIWLMGFPGGFKLNENLDNFLGILFLFYIERWSVIISSLSAFGTIIVKIIAAIGFVGGLSMQVSVALDLISFSTFHITSFYMASARVYSLQLNVLSSLWKLFRGECRDDRILNL